MTALLLSITALIAYTMGMLRTDIIASRFIFHRDLRSYSRDNFGITNFLNEYGWGGMVIVIGAEMLKTIVPVIIGSLLLSIIGEAQVGRAFAYFCVMMGTTFPVLYRFKGEHSLVAMITGLILIRFPLGLFTLLAIAAIYYFTHYVSLAVVGSSVITLVVSFMLLDSVWTQRLILAAAVTVLIEYRKSIVRLIRKKEPKFYFRRDLSYIFNDQI